LSKMPVKEKLSLCPVKIIAKFFANHQRIRKEEWGKYGFIEECALLVKYGVEETEIKGNPKIDPKILSAQYKFGMVLIGMALLKEFEKNEKKEENGNIYQEISAITQAISPFLLPMISSLGELEVSARDIVA